MEDNINIDLMPEESPTEILNKKLRTYFDGKIVRKDLTKSIKEGANVPVYVLEFLLGVHHIVQAFFALLAGEVVVATGAAALGVAFFAVHLVMTSNAFNLGMHRVGEHDGFLRTLEFQRFVRRGGGGKSGKSQSKHHDTGKNQNFLHGRPP